MPSSTCRCCGTPRSTTCRRGACIIVANEFVDALPVHQAVKAADGWHERVVAIGADGGLDIGAAREPLPHFETSMPRALRQATRRPIYEWRADDFALELGRRVRNDGAALIIDYGHDHASLGDTLQAVAGHSFTDPLRAPGKADLTAHVDFEALAQMRRNHGRAHPRTDLGSATCSSISASNSAPPRSRRSAPRKAAEIETRFRG